MIGDNTSTDALRAALTRDGQLTSTEAILLSVVEEIRHMRQDLRFMLVALVALAALGIVVSAGMVGVGLVLRADPAGAELRTVSAAIDSGDDTDTGDGRSASSDGQSSTTTPDLEGS